MKKLILPIIAFLVFLSFAQNSYAQDTQAPKDCLKEKLNAEYECGQIHKACVERCSGPKIDQCISACFDEQYKCDDAAKAEYDKCLKGQPFIKLEVKGSQPEVKSGDKITCDQVWNIVGSENCERFVVSNDEGGLWCNLPDTRESLQPWIYGPAATYTFTPGTCSVEEADQSQEEAGQLQEVKDQPKDQTQKSQEIQPRGWIPLFATGWVDYFKNLWTIASYRPSGNPFIEFANAFGGSLDHTLCDPSTCDISLEHFKRETGLSEEEIINNPPSRSEREINPYKVDRQSGEVYIDDYDKGKGFILKTGNNGVVFSTFLGDEDDIGGFEASPNTKMNLPPQPFQDWKEIEWKDKVELEYGEAEFFIIGSAEKATTRPTFTVVTPNAEVKVLGTHFWVKHDPDKQQTTVGVYEGEVEVTTKSGQKTTLTPSGGNPGVVVVNSKVSVVKLAVAGLVLAAIIGLGIFLLKRKFVAKGLSKKKR